MEVSAAIYIDDAQEMQDCRIIKRVGEIWSEETAAWRLNPRTRAEWTME